VISDYIPIVLLILVAILFVAAILIFSAITSQKAGGNPAKDNAYECGIAPLVGVHSRFSIKFYAIAILFILFDIEAAFLYPWAVVYKEMIKESLTIFYSMLAFLGILFVGFFYALKKGALDWK